MVAFEFRSCIAWHDGVGSTGFGWGSGRLVSSFGFLILQWKRAGEVMGHVTTLKQT